MRIGDRNGNFLIDGGYSEKCGRLLSVPEYGTGSVGPCAISIKDFRFALDETPSDDLIVDCRGGSLSIIDCTLGSRLRGRQVKIYVEPPDLESEYVKGSFRFEGNFLTSDGDGVVFTGATPDGEPCEWGKKNRVYRDGGMRYLVP